jgi:hypothetical protein
MAAKIDAAKELGEQLLRVLHAQRTSGPDAYPLTVRRLVELAAPDATLTQVAKALRKRTFQSQALVARRKEPEAPIALAADAEALACSRLLLEFLLRWLRTLSNQAFSVSNLKAKVTVKLQRPLQIAVGRQIEEGSLPPTVGCLTINRSKKLFLIADVRTGRQEPLASATATAAPTVAPVGAPSTAAPPHEDFAQAFDDAFGQLDRQAGGHNFVSLVDLRRLLPVGRPAFDAGLHDLRRAGRYGLSAAEGRHGLSTEESAAGILEDGTLLLYVSRKEP